MGRVREEKERSVKTSEKRKRGKKEEQARKKVEKSRHAVFPMICGSEGSKSRLAKAAGAEPAGQMRHEKLHAVAFPSQKNKNTSRSDHFLKLRG